MRTPAVAAVATRAAVVGIVELSPPHPTACSNLKVNSNLQLRLDSKVAEAPAT